MHADDRPPNPAAGQARDEGTKIRIFLLPNLLTAANLVCGFLALTWIARYQIGGSFEPIHMAVRFMLAAFVFDCVDGPLARVSGNMSRFGVEFDSLADLVSFGLGPAFLIHRIVLQSFPRLGLLIAGVYLICGAMRLARFNVIAQQKNRRLGREFVGFPIPAAAGLVMSLTLYLIWLDGQARTLGHAQLILPALMLLLSGLMISDVRYPTFKQVVWTPPRLALGAAAAAVVVLFLAISFHVTLALLFFLYLLAGLGLHFLRQTRVPRGLPPL